MQSLKWAMRCHQMAASKQSMQLMHQNIVYMTFKKGFRMHGPLRKFSNPFP